MHRTKRRATVISTNIRHRKHGVKSIRRDEKLFALTTLFVVGLVFGACYIKCHSGENTGSLNQFIERYFTELQSRNSFHCCLLYAKANVLYMVSVFAFGVCLLGEPVLWVAPLAKGFLLGTFSGYLYSTNSLTGMSAFSLIFLLPSVLSTASFLIGCKESILTVRDLNRIIFKGEKNTAGKETLKLYLLRYCILCLGSLIASILFGVLYSVLHIKFTLTFPA